MPYRTLDDRIDGVVITFADITAAKKLEAQLREKHTVGEPLREAGPGSEAAAERRKAKAGRRPRSYGSPFPVGEASEAMKKVPSKSKSLRTRSETRLRGHHDQEGEPNVMYNTQRLFHELQVHQIELELQNEELSHANAAASSALEKYTDLYDFAPVGYFSLDEKGLMLESNMAGAVLLGVERSRLTGRRFQLFVSPKDRPVFQRFIDRIFSGSGKHYCEVELLREAQGPFWAELAGISVPITTGSPRLSRIVVSDISARRLAEKEHKRIGILAAANRELEKEIVLRRASEAALKKSEERFRMLLQQSRVLQARLRLMTHEMLKAQEDQRKKISRELHDEISQILLGINVQLAVFAKVAATHPQRIKKAIGPVRRIVEKAVEIVHRFARELRPAMLDDLGSRLRPCAPT